MSEDLRNCREGGTERVRETMVGKWSGGGGEEEVGGREEEVWHDGSSLRVLRALGDEDGDWGG
jgi:hypothetical protein